jgi:predicted MPP superfamily phosphohydrolase
MARRFGSRRFWKRRGLISLALNSPEPGSPPPSFSPDPEITEIDIWLRRLPVAFNGLRIVHLTDIHHSLFTPLEDVQRAVYLANLLRPDLIALTGDYVTLSPTYIWPVARALGKLRARLGMFAVLGNQDFQVDAGEIARAFRAQHIRVLRNSHSALRAGSEIGRAHV